MTPLEPKPPDPFIPCCLSCSCSQNLYLKSFEPHGQIHCINYALKVVDTRLALSQPSQLGLVIEAVRSHGVLGIQMLESGTSMSLRVRRSNGSLISLQSSCHIKGNSSTFRRTADQIEINRYLGLTSAVTLEKRMLGNCNSLTCYRHYPSGVANITNPVIASYERIPQIGIMLYSTLIWVCNFNLFCHRCRLSDPLTSHENY
ncbi:hypothetical protein Cgig2_023535 [Carnegiea gigantea]|uniref:Uncharacterized protein n=1 Tax=Carnegiea gigantea TaxID=171969 RepID=A0A9Q1GVQ5_9CARY|nr:hypothetical protein Cgig2_023535 [Carnegiea gigantea]